MNRYTNQIQLAGIGARGQEKLAKARVLVVGAGGLGCAVIPYLAGSGVGYMGIVDGDTVEESNLHRQILYREADLHSLKAQQAAEYVRGYNSGIIVQAWSVFLDEENAREIMSRYDIIVDATDHISIRMLINEVAEQLDKPVVYASVYKYEAQLSVFNYQGGPTYRSVFGQQINRLPGCVQTGVLGTTAGIIGVMQANEVIKMILGTGEVLSGKLLVYNSLTNEQNVFKVSGKDDSTKSFSLHIPEKTDPYSRSASQAYHSKDSLIIDIREPYEIPNLMHPGVKKVPLSRLEDFMDNIPRDQSIYFLCQRGTRSLATARRYGRKGYNVKSIAGGVIHFKNNSHEQ